MKRRDLIAGLGAAAASSVFQPLTTSAQSQPVIGFLGNGSADGFVPHVAAFRQGLKDAGIADGQHVIDFRWAAGHSERLPALAQELVRRPVDVIATIGGIVTARAAKAATSTIPIVFVTADDPVATGLVASLSRPDANLTGVARLNVELSGKTLEVMHELVPAAPVIGLLINPQRLTAETQLRNAQVAAKSFGKTIRVLHASSEREIDAVFETIAVERIGALIVNTEPLFNNRTTQIVALAARRGVPTIYFQREFVTAGGLISYGSSLPEVYRQSGEYTGRILKGAKPADLPVQQATKVELIVNLKTAKTLGLIIPITLLGRADEVIE